MAKKFAPKVSDHAIVRYMERVLDLDVDKMREWILIPKVKAAAELGAHNITVDGVCYMIREGVVTTIKVVQK